jgi:hypothetical protein
MFIGVTFLGALLAACSGSTVVGSPTTTSSGQPTSTGSTTLAPPVQNPLPAKAIDGSPCDSALSGTQLSDLIGKTDPAKPGDTPLGSSCSWENASANGAGISVYYQTKSDQGLNLAYKNVKPTATHWEELQPIQGYPAVGYRAAGDTDTTGTDHCNVVVGISATLSYSVAITMSTTAIAKKIDACAAGRDVADRVLTNIKARA